MHGVIRCKHCSTTYDLIGWPKRNISEDTTVFIRCHCGKELKFHAWEIAVSDGPPGQSRIELFRLGAVAKGPHEYLKDMDLVLEIQRRKNLHSLRELSGITPATELLSMILEHARFRGTIY
jgi:hypothetical protein